MNVEVVARHWANRIRVELAGYDDMMKIAADLLTGNIEAVYKEHRYLVNQSITKIPGKPIKLYYLKELVLDLHRFYS